MASKRRNEHKQMNKTSTDFSGTFANERSLSALAGAGQTVGMGGIDGIKHKSIHVQDRF